MMPVRLADKVSCQSKWNCLFCWKDYLRAKFNSLTQDLIELLNKIVGERMRELRERREITQEGLSQLVGISRASISNIEQGKQQPPLGILYAIANCLQSDITDILPSYSSLVSVANKTQDRAREILNRHNVSEDLKKTISGLINDQKDEI